jgi:hypothetical protein
LEVKRSPGFGETQQGLIDEDLDGNEELVPAVTLLIQMELVGKPSPNLKVLDHGVSKPPFLHQAPRVFQFRFGVDVDFDVSPVIQASPSITGVEKRG